MSGIFRKLFDIITMNHGGFGPDRLKSDAAVSKDVVLTFTAEEELKINQIESSCQLDFFFINDYAKDLFMQTANLFSDGVVTLQSQLIDNATNKLNEILDMLTKMDDKNFSMLSIKEINLLTHYYRDEVYKYIVTLNEKKNIGLDFFREYDMYVEAAHRYINEIEKTLVLSIDDPLEKHLLEEKRKNVERFKDKMVKLRTNKLYHSQSLLQISVIHSVSEKIYEQMNEIIFIVIPVLKNKSSINVSMDQMKRIKNNLLSLKEDKDKKLAVSA